MVVYFATQALLPHVRWSKTVYPRLLRLPDFWLAICTHAALVALLKFEYLGLPDSGRFVPIELAVPLLAIVIIGLLHLSGIFWQRYEAIVRGCSRVGEESRLFVQELQATLGRVDEALCLRFAAAKYSLAVVYIVFFTITGGSVSGRGWSELRAKGLLDDREVNFLENEYNGDRVSLLHVWAMWVVNEASTLPAVRSQTSSEVLAGGLARMSAALQGVASSAKEVSGYVATPVPYHYLQLVDTAAFAAILTFAAVAAPFARSTYYVASVAYVALLVAVLGLREVASSLADPLCKGSVCSFPVASTVNATADAVAQLLLGSTPASFNPCQAWFDSSRSLFTQAQLERRTATTVFTLGGANPCRWKEVKAPVEGDQAPPPLLDAGCCHLDVEALPQRNTGKRAAHAYQVARRPRQEGVSALLKRVQADVEMRGKVKKLAGYSERSTTGGSDFGSEVNSRQCSTLGQEHDWDVIADHMSAVPREASLASSTPGTGPPTPAQWRGRLDDNTHLASVAPIAASGKWANPAEQQRMGRSGAGSASVSPDSLPLVRAAAGGHTHGAGVQSSVAADPPRVSVSTSPDRNEDLKHHQAPPSLASGASSKPGADAAAAGAGGVYSLIYGSCVSTNGIIAPEVPHPCQT